ncbi:MAG TPA: MlaD family protein [Baekduia sp.]|nr:MlaD family protein [Baekduia sp.]
MRIEHRRWKISGLLLFTAVCVAIFIYLYQAAGGVLRLSTPYQAKVQVPTAFQLVENGDVRRDGVKIGVVRDITNVGDTGLVTVEISSDKHAPLYKDATVQVRTKTLVGENYLDVDPGTPQAGELPDGGTLPLARAADAVQLDEILDSLDRDTRRQVQRNLDVLGPGFQDRGKALNRLWAAVRPTARDGGTAMRILASQRRQLAALVHDTGQTLQAFGDRKQQVRTLAVQARRTAQAAASRDDAFRAAFRELGPTLTQAQSSVDRLGSFASRSTPTVGKLAGVAADLRPVMRDLRPAVAETRQLFDELPGALKQTDPLLQALRPFAGKLEPAIGALDAFLRQAGPTVQYLSPYDKDIGSFFANVGSALGARDATGGKGRVHAVFAASSLTHFTPAMRKALNAFMELGAASIYNGELDNAYPRPGEAGDPKPFKGTYDRVTPDE